MKYSVATIAALATAVTATPHLLNTDYTVVIGTPFTIEFDGCAKGCTILLQNGSSKDLKTVETLTATATGGSFTWTPKDLPTDTYAYKITENDTGDFNYSGQFEIKGDVAATTSAAESTTAESTSAESTEAATSTKKATTLSTKAVSTTEEATTISTPASTAHNSTTPASTESGASSTAESASTGTEASSTAASATSSSTTVPDSGATRMTSSIALIAGAVMAMVYLN
ncbi:hypothetical protein BKA56DRAFT_664674 [Ilyonectria sp. MPI-CAGE-AT-0026]|nr:hypothetical protein BKA56DRAFT_664674 [Ilyonectria sp. MPI-CAGE-AT-0026]